MRRLLALLVLALAPLLASAHQGPHASAAQAGPHGSIQAIAAATARCPSGDHESCCCHEPTCTPSFQPVAVDAPVAKRGSSGVCGEINVQAMTDAPRMAPVNRHSPRGPPPRS